MVRRATPEASSLEEANNIVRGNWLQAIAKHHLQYSGNSMIRDILDIGCSVGVSTRYLADKFPSAKVTVRGKFPSVWSLKTGVFSLLLIFVLMNLNLLQGLDLSPYFLSVAKFKETRRTSRQNPINWVHANGEDTGLPSKSFDIVSMAYVVCPFWLITCMNTLYLPLDLGLRISTSLWIALFLKKEKQLIFFIILLIKSFEHGTSK